MKVLLRQIFWLNHSSNETTTTTQFDRFFVEIRNTSGTLLSTLATFSHLNRTTVRNYTRCNSSGT